MPAIFVTIGNRMSRDVPHHTDTFAIRRATAADAPAILSAHVQAIRQICQTQYTPEQIEAWAGPKKAQDYANAMARGEAMFVAEMDSQIVGFSAIDRDAIKAVYVLPSAQHRGIGAALLAAVEGEARASGVCKVSLESTVNAVSFYKLHGYQRGDDTVHMMRGVPIPCVKMNKTT
jgi:GNAT superfamily N-acetyltransferase